MTCVKESGEIYKKKSDILTLDDLVEQTPSCLKVKI